MPSATLLPTLLLLTASVPLVAQEDRSSHRSTIEVPAGSYRPLLVTSMEIVDVSGFRIDVLPVTQEEFLGFVTTHERWRRSAAPSVFVGTSYLASWDSDLDPATDLQRPVTEVSWFAARAFCASRDGRLPTTDEWEYLATMPETTEESALLRHRRSLALQQRRPGFHELPAVGRTDRNHLGVWDLHGLIWEWTSDFNNQMMTGAGRNDRGLDRGLYCAAGSVGVPDPSDYAAFLRHAYRASLDGASGGLLLGFRCAYPD